ncbi:hypothetical protein RF11_06082 [Thelohanellus kitauei]|uniref:Uncharacterized protein n=1 Tax=Thelohanellus kitauei TaxID=669202 RepID=A0A0C2IAJ9_THEKT|nr:hypothetical protein RF11_06082 [Thelohanellus kitauei]
MLSLVILFACIPRFKGYNTSIYDIEACYRIIKSGTTVLVGFRFPVFNYLYPPILYMKIKRTYEGWRINCPSNIPKSMMIEDVVYDPSWSVNFVLIEEIQIEMSILDEGEDIKEKSIIRLENGIKTVLPESQIFFPDLNFRIFGRVDYISYTSDIKVRVVNIITLFELDEEHYECKINSKNIILTEYSFKAYVIDRCMVRMIPYGNDSGIRLWENIEHISTSECKRRCKYGLHRRWSGFIN